ncbi:MAG: helix-turn-helix transcriptional regulator [Clostridia bacterium]|nr:helix-turn-helix transcriptional regulator [Clostridia bacterium]MBQ5772389.1 helix-turn-helix transcriptional regulator [Clostridia bacterium]
MSIGEKIRELRVAKLMTQAELAGTQITRNMLSCIENGSANPSLSTVLYIAGRLNVPAGFLLAEEGDEALYRKMQGFSNIKRAYTAGDLRGCRSLCISACPQADDEIGLLLASCDVGIAEEEFWAGRLRSACRFFDEALSYADKTMYPTDQLEARVSVYFRYMRRISPTLYSDFLDEEKQPAFFWSSPFSAYVDTLDALDDGDALSAERYLESAEGGSFFASHVRIRLQMERGEYREAKEALLTLLQAEELLREVELYTVLCELEVACRETEDFKGAYRYANEKLQALEHLLKEF